MRRNKKAFLSDKYKEIEGNNRIEENQNAKEKRKAIPILMQSSKEQKGEIRKLSSVVRANKQRKNNRIGKTTDLFKKVRDTKGKFHAKMGIIKDRNGMNLTEAEDTKKR